MDTQRVRLLQQCIDAEQRKLEAAKGTFVIQPCADDNELASHYESTHAGIVFMQRAQGRLQYLTRQMALIESQSQALCTGCGEPISLQRLTVVPDAVRCAACQMEWEEEEEQRRRPHRNDAYDALVLHA